MWSMTKTAMRTGSCRSAKNKDDGGTPMPDDVVIVREEPQRPQLTELHAQLLPENALRRDAQTVLSQHPDALVIDVKLRDGTVTYQTSGGRRAVCHWSAMRARLKTSARSCRATAGRSRASPRSPTTPMPGAARRDGSAP